MVWSSSSISLHIDILRWYQFSIQVFKSQMCFKQKTTRDPKVLCSTRIKSKRNSSTLVDMHRSREAKYFDLHSKMLLTVGGRKPFSSHSNEMRQAFRLAPATSEVYIMHQFRKYCHSFQWLELSVKKIYCHPFEELVGAIRSKTITNF